MSKSFRVKNSVTIIPSAVGTTEAGELRVDAGDNSLKYHDGSTEEAVVLQPALDDVSADLGTAEDDIEQLQTDVDAAEAAIALKAPIASPTFTGTVSGITSSMVGLGNVDNTSDANKPVSTATQTALNLKANIASPTFTGTVSGVTAAMVGLGNVDNTSDANKPVSTATQAALDLKANLASPTFTGTVAGITKSMVGLGNVDNTADTAKPVSTAQQTALDLKANLASPTFTGTVSGVTAAMVGLGNVDNTSDATKNAASATLTNKTIDGLLNTITNVTAAAPGATYYTGSYPQSNTNYWSRTNNAIGDFTVSGTIPTITAGISSGFTVTNASSNLPGFAFTAPRSGIIKIAVIAAVLPGQTASNVVWELRLLESNTTTTIADFGGGVTAQATTNSQWAIPLIGYFSATATTAYNFKLQGSISSNTIFVGANTRGNALTICLEYIT